MNFNKCREILETIRTYMLTPRLAFIFAGDLKLYSLVIRAMQIGHFGQISLQYDAERRHQRRRLLDQLEEQYLIKMFPSDNRVNLSNFSATLKKDARLDYHENETESLKDFLERCISAYAPQIARGRMRMIISLTCCIRPIIQSAYGHPEALTLIQASVVN